MNATSTLEEQLLAAFRETHEALFIGIDHHGDQMTVAVALGKEISTRQLAKPGYRWIPTKVFDQDALGYLALLDFLSERFPDVPRGRYRFLSEPSYAKPCCHFLFNAGFGRHQVLWADTRKVSQFRKVHHLQASGKNDADDARAMTAMLYLASSQPTATVELFELPQVAAISAALGGLAEEHERLSRQGAELKNRIAQLVMLLFPELRRVWARTRSFSAPGVGSYQRRELALFNTLTPLRLLAQFPTPKDIAEAGFQAVWAAVGGVGVKKATIERVVELAKLSAGVDAPHEARRLSLLVQELLALEVRKEAYKAEIARVLEADPVFASLTRIPWLAPHQLATIIGLIGDPARFRSVDAVKRYLNLAPRPMPQTGNLDERGRPVQIWRFPANTYEVVNGQKKLVYRISGGQEARVVGYLAFENLMMGQNRQPDDPFVRYYRSLLETHQGRTRKLGRIRWKVVSKLVGVIYHCWKNQTPYNPAHAARSEVVMAA